jgi:2-keto-4-pentenoate hydratase/2-oxohepta-3-ene-1,7-dioic acid hydratase in catechol pathway
MSLRLVCTERGIGRLDGDRVQLLDCEFTDLGAALAAGVSLAEVGASAVRESVAVEDVSLQAPVSVPPQIWAVGLNYKAHVDEIKGMDLTEPFIFPKDPTAVIGPGAPIVIPPFAASNVDYEGEMAIVIGRRAESVRAADAAAHVAGVTICNDVSARDLQKGQPGIRSNISMAKSLRSFAPLGPAVTVVESLDALDDLKIETRVNGEVRQSASTAQTIYGIAELIEFLTARVTLLPGAIVATGTPEGVGDVDGRFLAPGDQVEIELEGVGTLVNPVVAAA